MLFVCLDSLNTKQQEDPNTIMCQPENFNGREVVYLEPSIVVFPLKMKRSIRM